MTEDQNSGINIPEIAAMGAAEVQKLYREKFGANVPGGNTEHARRKIAWHLQARAEGGLPESVRQHGLGIARAQRLHRVMERNQIKRASGIKLPNASSARVHVDQDCRIPLPGSVLVKDYGNKTHIVHVLDSGFEYEGEQFPSLSALANRISGSRWNGYLFFGLQKAASHVR